MPDINEMKFEEIIDKLISDLSVRKDLCQGERDETGRQYNIIIINDLQSAKYNYKESKKANAIGDVFGIVECKKCHGHMEFKGVKKLPPFSGLNTSSINWSCCGTSRFCYMNDYDRKRWEEWKKKHPEEYAELYPDGP